MCRRLHLFIKIIIYGIINFSEDQWAINMWSKVLCTVCLIECVCIQLINSRIYWFRTFVTKWVNNLSVKQCFPLSVSLYFFWLLASCAIYVLAPCLTRCFHDLNSTNRVYRKHNSSRLDVTTWVYVK